MKIKDIVDLHGCYSAHDVGEKEIDLNKLISIEKIEEIIELYNSSNAPIDGAKCTWVEFKSHFANSLRSEFLSGLHGNGLPKI